MQHCPNCRYENTSSGQFCERCGNFLLSDSQSFTESPDSQTISSEYNKIPAPPETATAYPNTPPPPSETATAYQYYKTPPPPPPPASAGAHQYHNSPTYAAEPSLKFIPFTLPEYQSAVFTTPKSGRTVGEMVYSIYLFLWGTLCVSFALAGNGLLKPAGISVITLTFLGCNALGPLILVLVLKRHKHPYLRRWTRVGVEVGVGIICFLVLIINQVGMSSYASHWPAHTDAGICLLYGLAVAILAVY